MYYVFNLSYRPDYDFKKPIERYEIKINTNQFIIVPVYDYQLGRLLILFLLVFYPSSVDIKKNFKKKVHDNIVTGSYA